MRCPGPWPTSKGIHGNRNSTKTTTDKWHMIALCDSSTNPSLLPYRATNVTFRWQVVPNSAVVLVQYLYHISCLVGNEVHDQRASDLWQVIKLVILYVKLSILGNTSLIE